MTIALARVLATLHLENDDLVTLYKGVHYFYYYFGTLYLWCTDSYCTLIVYEQYLVELNSLTGLNILDVVNEQFLALLDLKLLTVNLYDCVHFVNINGFFRKASNLLLLLFRPPRSKSSAKLQKNHSIKWL